MEERPLIRLNRDASADGARAVAAAFRDMGIDAGVETKAVLTAGDSVWIIWVTAPLNVFMRSIAAEAAKDTYAALKGFLGRLRDAHDGDELMIYIGSRPPLPEQPRGNQIIMRSDLSEEALQALIDLDTSQIGEQTTLLWVEDEGRWVDVSTLD